MDPHTVYHIKGHFIWALGPKAKHEIEKSMGPRIRRRHSTGLINIIQENISGKKRIP